MLVTFGTKKGKSVEWLVLKDPSYIQWVLKQSASGALLQVRQHAESLINNFDAKSFLKTCRADNCSQVATRATVYLENIEPEWWCAKCNPYQLGANAGKLQEISEYRQALRHVDIYCKRRKSDACTIIKYLAQAKGLPKRVSEDQVQNFFA